MTARVMLVAAVGAAAFALLALWRGFFWQHALIGGLAIAALLYSGLRAVDRLRELFRR